MKRKTRLKYDNIFIVASIVFLGLLFLIYSIRFIYFFAIERKKPTTDSTTFSDYLVKTDLDLKKISKNKYIYYGKDINNYVYYSGIMFRIVSIENGNIKLVTDEVITSLVWNYDATDYSDTFGNKWLNSTGEELTGIFQDILVDKTKYLVPTKTCIDEVNDYNVKICKKYNTDYYVGILSLDEYINSHANNGYLNTNNYFWLSNTSLNGNNWYVYNTGGISSNSKTEVTYHSFGIRPTITLNKNVSLVKGTGTSNDPYRIEIDDNKLLLNKYVGSYIEYAGFTWRIIGRNDNSVKLALSDCIKIDGENVSKLYDLEGSKYYNSNFYTYLNNNFYKRLTDTKHIIKSSWYDGAYNIDSKYDYRNIYTNSISANVGTVNMSDLFMNDVDNIFTMTPSTEETLYSIQENKIFVDAMENKLNIRPVIYIDGMLNVIGEGTLTLPYKIEEV